MKTNKDQVYDLLKMHFTQEQSAGATTQYIADTLGIQRTNVSAILNSLVGEGLVIKQNGRPVLYYAKEQNASADACFDNLLGSKGSLKRAVQLAKAAILYPQGSLDAMIAGAPGTGKKLLALVMHRYAIDSGTLAQDAPYQIFKCNAADDEERQFNALFGNAGGCAVYDEARGGILVLDGVDAFSPAMCLRVLDRIEDEAAQAAVKPVPIVLFLVNTAQSDTYNELKKRLPISIELPTMAERPLEERLEIIQSFLVLEAARAHRTIVVNAELMRCLLLYDADINVARLKYDIKIGCANAYVREHGIKSQEMNLYMGDFENRVRKGFLRYRSSREEVERIIPADYSYRFDEHSFEMTAIDRERVGSNTMYSIIDDRSRQLAERGIPQEDIGLLLVSELESIYRSYQKEIGSKVMNTDQLRQLVDGRVITLVRTFLDEATDKLMKVYPASVFYGLCLHLDTTLKNGWKSVKLTNEQIKEIIENYKVEYSLSMQLAAGVEKEFGVRLPVDEIVLLTMFISFKATPTDTSNKPVLLFAMRGAGLAQAYSALINQSLQLDNSFHFEIPMDREPIEYYDDLCGYIRKIDRGRGVVVFYDVEFMRNVLEAIKAETGIEIRRGFMPFTNMAFDVSRAAAIENDIDALYKNMNAMFEQYMKPKADVIVTLCATGVGGAVELKKYIEKYGVDSKTRVIAFAMAGTEQLREDLSQVMEYANIRCVVGTHDPQMFGLPFVPVHEVFGCPPEDLPLVLNTTQRAKATQMKSLDYEEIYKYLDESFENMDIGKLKRLLPKAMQEINAGILPLSFDTEIGLFLHIPCAIERLLEKGETQVCIQKTQIINKYHEGYKKLVKLLKPLEKAYGVIFTDDELAIMLTIIYKL